MNRGYLLPEGCKDLVDAWKAKELPHPFSFLPAIYPGKGVGHWITHPMPLKGPHYKGMLKVPAQVSVLELATMLNQNMSRIFADLLEFGGLAAVKEQLDFATIKKIARKYGFIAVKVKE